MPTDSTISRAGIIYFVHVSDFQHLTFGLGRPIGPQRNYTCKLKTGGGETEPGFLGPAGKN